MKCVIDYRFWAWTCLMITLPTGECDSNIDIANTLRQFLLPFFRSSYNIKVKESKDLPVKALIEAKDLPVKALIEAKVKELKDYLQDHDNENNFDDDETTIIEFLPKHKSYPPKHILREKTQSQTQTVPYKFDVKKYNKFRKKINKTLNKESVSNKTRDYITRKFDLLVDELLKSQCTWNNNDEVKPKFRQEGDKKPDISEKWHAKWYELKNTYLETFQNIEEPITIKDLKEIFEQFQEFYSHVLKDINGLATHYEVRCKLINKSKDIVRRSNSGDKVGEKTCKRFKVCSKELTTFLTDFYDHLIKTTRTTLSNYAEMYSRDVNNDDLGEKTKVKETIVNLATEIKRKITHIFKKSIQMMRLDKKKKKEKNIRHITEYINITIDPIKQKINKYLESNMKELRAKVRLAVKEDVYRTIDADLNKLANETIDKICSSFRTCNDDDGRRYMSTSHGKKGHGLYIQLDLNIDETPKSLRIPDRRQNKEETTVQKGYLSEEMIKLSKTRSNVTDYTNDLNITRTNETTDERKYENITMTRTSQLKLTTLNYEKYHKKKGTGMPLDHSSFV